MQEMEELIRKYNAGQCTAQEKLLLEQWYQFFEMSRDKKLESSRNSQFPEYDIWFAIQRGILKSPTKKLSHLPDKRSFLVRRWRLAGAAIMLVSFVLFSVYFIKSTDRQMSAVIPNRPIIIDTLINAGTNKAYLTLGDGRVVSLDSSQNIQLTEKDGTHIQKRSGRLVYNKMAAHDEKIVFNTLTVPRGGEYQLVLPDGTKVWLNASSSLKYPTQFSSQDRTVSLMGEGYFEVAKDKACPFFVKLDNKVTIEVIGTHFNVMCYSDENEVRATLTEGMVKLRSGEQSMLVPAFKQGVIPRNHQSVHLVDADLVNALAWKNGMIEIGGNDLQYIMRQISRWYDVDVIFKGRVPDGIYKGAIRRKAPLKDVLEILRLTGVQCILEGRRLLITGG